MLALQLYFIFIFPEKPGKVNFLAHKFILITHINSYFIASPLHAELVQALDKKGLKQNVFVPVQSAHLINKNSPGELVHGKIFYTHCFNKADRYLWPVKMFKIWRTFKKYFDPEHVDIIHAHTLIVNGLIAYWAHKRFGIPYIVTVRNTDFNVFLNRIPFFRVLAGKILQHACQIITVSPAYLDVQMNKYFSKEKYHNLYEKSTVIPNGINDYWFRERYRKTQKQKLPTIVFSGRIDKNKNLSALISACSLLKKEGFGFQLNVLGEGPLYPELSRAAYPFPLVFYGHIASKERIRDILLQSDLLVVPSYAETFGLVYPEAMSQGLPVIYSRNQGFDGYFPEGFVGYSVNPDNVNEIAEKIKLVFEDYERLSENAFVSSEQFTWEKVTDRLIELYQRTDLQNRN